MRFVATMLLWLVTTLALAVAVPAAWAQQNVIDLNGYSDFSAAAAKDPKLQEAMAGELTSQVASMTSGSVNTDLVRRVAGGYTASDAFPGQFALANEVVHRWMFTESVQRTGESGDQWAIDLGPMLSDSSFQQTLNQFGIEPPQTLTVPVTAGTPDGLQPGKLQPLAQWGPCVSVGSAVAAGVLALLTLAAARSRGKGLAALGVSALLVGAAGWAGLEAARGYVNDALNQTTGDIRQIADAMVGHAQDGLHHWFNLTLAAGGVLVVLGVLASMLGGVRRVKQPKQ